MSGNENNNAGEINPQLTAAEQEAAKTFTDNGYPSETGEAPAAEATPAAEADKGTPAADADKEKGADGDKGADADKGAAAADAEADKGEADKGAAAAATPPAQGGVFAPQINPGAPRDFKKDLSELKEKYGNGELDDDAYEEARDKIIEDRAVYAALAATAEQTAEQTWKHNVKLFLSQPENAIVTRSEMMKDLWQTTMNRIAAEAVAANKPVPDDWDLLTQSRDRLMKELGISATQVATPAAAEAKPGEPKPRVPDTSKLPPAVSTATAAATPGAKTAAEKVANADNIFDIENAFAGMTDAQADDILSKVPGAFAD